MKRRNIALISFFALILLASCEKEISNTYDVSNNVKEFINYGEVGTQWIYDVDIQKTYTLSTRFFVSDTLIRNSMDYNTGEKKLNPLTIAGRKIDTVFNVKDSVFILGAYRIFEDEIHITDTVYIKVSLDPDRNDVGFVAPYAYVNRIPYDLAKDDEDSYNDPDSSLFEYFYTVQVQVEADDLIGTIDTMYISKIEEGSFELNMRNRSSEEKYAKTYIKSSLDPEITYIETVSASSSGFEYFRRDNQRFISSANAIELTFDSDGNMDKSFFSNESGVASYETIEGAVSVNGKDYNNVNKIVTNFVETNSDGDGVNTNVEYWYIKGFGMIKIQDNTNQITWTLR